MTRGYEKLSNKKSAPPPTLPSVEGRGAPTIILPSEARHFKELCTVSTSLVSHPKTPTLFREKKRKRSGRWTIPRPRWGQSPFFFSRKIHFLGQETSPHGKISPGSSQQELPPDIVARVLHYIPSRPLFYWAVSCNFSRMSSRITSSFTIPYVT